MDDLPLNLLLFPLVGGYYITTRLETAKFISHRLSSQTILFNAILVAMPLLAVSLAITTITTIIFPSQVMWTKFHIFPIKQDFFGTCVLSLVIAFVYTKYRNHKINDTEANYRAIRLVGNELELLFAVSAQESQLIQITLKNDKVYIGWVKVLPKPSESPYIQLIPLFSGYRNEEKKLFISTDYATIYNDMITRGKINRLEDADMNLVVQVNEIISACKFDYDIFEQFMNARQSNKSAE